MYTRIKELRKMLNITQKEFATKIGLKPSTLSDIEHNNCGISERVIIAICAKFHVNENWLRTGKGNVFIEEDKKFNEFFELYKNLSSPLQDFLIQVTKDLLDTQDKL